MKQPHPSYLLVAFALLTSATAQAVDDFGLLGGGLLLRPSVRLVAGTAPAIDEVDGSASFNGTSVPAVEGGNASWFGGGGGWQPSLGIEVIGSGATVFGDDSSRLGVAIQWNRRADSYALNGYATPDVRVDTIGLSLLGGRAWQWGRNVQFELLGRVGAGWLRSCEYILQPDTATWGTGGDGRGGFIEGGVRAAIVYLSGDWVCGTQVEYVVGAGHAEWRESGTLGDSEGDSSYAWYGIGAALFLGRSF